MIDIHSHVIYGVDDGARTLEDSIAMVRMAAENGTTDLVATPHANLRYWFEPEVTRHRLAEIEQATAGMLRLYPGCDFHLSYENIQDALEHPHKYTIANGNYLLVEFSELLIFHNTTEIFSRLQETGAIPIITHPERNGLLRQRLKEIESWVDSGVCLQITAQSLTGDFGRRAQNFCETLLNRGLVHFVASDAHDCEHRPPKMDDAAAWLKSRYGEATANLLCTENPRAAIDGGPVAAPEKPASGGARKWYRFWR